MLRPTHHTRATRGFTLLEVLIAVALLAMGMVLVLGSMQGSLQMEHKSRQLNDVNQAAYTTMRRLVSELDMAFYVSEVSEDVSKSREIRYRTIFEGDRDKITFTTMSYQQRFSDQANGDQAVISYDVERRSNRKGHNRRVLMRREKAPVDDKPERGGRLQVVMENVKRIRFEYWDSDKDIAGDAWVDQWNASKRDDEKLPSRVRITLEVDNPIKAHDTLTYRMEAHIALQEPLLLLPADVAKRLMQEKRAKDEAIEAAGGNARQADENSTGTRDQIRQAAGKN